MPNALLRALLPTLSGIGIAALVSGCSGTSPQLRQPQLDAGSAAMRSVGATDMVDESKLPALEKVETPTDGFFTLPYIQLGDNRTMGKNESLVLIWHTAGLTDKSAWTVETRRATGGAWEATSGKPTAHPVTTLEEAPHQIWKVTLNNLKPGALFDYRVVKDGKPVFAARARARRGAKEPYRFVVFGDCSENTVGQKKIAYQTSLLKPDFVAITGDIVYSQGRISEYRKKYFPVYNAESADPEVGAPLIRSTLFIGAPGNHDILHRDLDQSPDDLAYFFYWVQPLNGPLVTAGAPNTPTLSGSDAHQKAFLSAAGNQYPRMANFSYDYGNAHWTILDANGYVNWNDKDLRAWLEKDLAGAQKATWRFVAWHQPGFNSSKAHHSEQQMRVISPILEKYHVNIVFNGHVHNYQRSFPMTFVPAPDSKSNGGPVKGEWTLDKEFDGVKKTVPNGIIYLVTGGGGAGLYNPEQQQHPETWDPFTDKYVADAHSLTVVDVNDKTLAIRQIDETGKERDSFTVTQPK